MQCSDGFTLRVEAARQRAVSAPMLTWNDRVLLAVAEAADVVVPRPLRAAVACVVADGIAAAAREAKTVAELQVAIEAALGNRARSIPRKLAWRVAFDLWGGPTR